MPKGPFTAISSGASNTCALRPTGVIACWATERQDSGYPFPEPPVQLDGGPFVAVSSSLAHICGLRDDGAVVCWKVSPNAIPTLETRREGQYIAISAGLLVACGIQTDTSIDCWALPGVE